MASKFLILFFLPTFTNAVSFTTKLTNINNHHKYSSSLSSKSPNGTISSTILPNNADHLMEFSIGTPPVKVLAIVDTGSDLIWSRCKPCVDCDGRDIPVFDPGMSSSYRNLPCNSSLCKHVDPSACSKGPTCQYMYGYGDGSFTKGVLATETLTFRSTDNKSIAIPTIGFGCGHNVSTSFNNHQIGLVGLGGQPTSLTSQLGPSIGWKFSYCLVPFHENLSSSVINFGDSAVVSGPNVVSTPLVPKEDKTYYYVTLESVTVGSYKISASDTGTGNMFIDSGTTVTLLNEGVLKQLAGAIKNIVKKPTTMDAGGTFYCYNARSREEFPQITFTFASGADLVMEPMNTFTMPSPEGLVCLAMQGTNGTGVFGNLVQQNFHVGFDLKEKKVSFAPTECSEMSS